MNTIRKLFELINKFLDTSLNAADAVDNQINEVINWSDELVIESQLARKSLAVDRAKRVEELEAKAEDLPALEEA